MEKSFCRVNIQIKAKRRGKRDRARCFVSKVLGHKRVFFGPKDSYLECSLLEVASKQKKAMVP